MELDHLNKDTESLTNLVLEMNQRLDTISKAFNELPPIDPERVVATESSPVTFLQSVLKSIKGKFLKLGTSNGTTIGTNSLFVDRTDLKLKFKDKNSITTTLN
jgi:hypothetical protein